MRFAARLRALRPAFAAALAACALACSTPLDVRDTGAPLPLIPYPAKLERAEGAFRLAPGTRIAFRDAGVEPVAQRIAELLSDAGVKVIASAGSPAVEGAVVLELTAAEDGGSAEGYSLSVSPQRIVISASSLRGLFYGGVTLWQLATAEPARADGVVLVPAVEIADAPRFAWRGLMLDVARHYLPPEEIRRFIDAMARHKLNTLHWHLTDDQGWRIEIRKYPRLTEVGAWRVPAGAAGRDPATGQPRRYGGYYTQEEVRALVEYAAERFVTIVPEIEMPGHAQAAIAAYPRLGTGETPTVSSDWGVHTWLFNVDEGTFAFLEDVLTEVIGLFPGKYIHVGGDEAAKDRWEASARVQQRMRELGVASEVELQSYFTRRIERFLNAHGRSLIGWDEILEGGIAPGATVMSWRGVEGAIEAARDGHDVIMAPSPALYLDHLQSTLPDEAPGRPDPITLESIYAYEPVPVAMPREAVGHVLGAQVNFWSEHMRTPQRVERAAFPRVAALAEVVWSTRESRDWSSFKARLPVQLRRYRALGIDFADSAFAPALQSDYTPDGKTVKVILSNQLDTGVIRYTLDGTEPSVTARAYDTPLDLTLPVTLRAATFFDGEAASAPRTWTLDDVARLTRRDEELKLCSGKLPLHLEDDAPYEGERAVFLVDIMDPCWIYERAPLEGVRALRVTVGQVPYNFQLWKDAAGVVKRQPADGHDALEVRAGGCAGDVIARLPLAPAKDNDELAALEAPLAPSSGAHDLCFAFATRTLDPLWVLDRVSLVTSSSDRASR